MKNIIFIAPPAAGKGTQSNMLKDKYGYVHISVGDLLRKEVALETASGKAVKNIIDSGELVADDLVFAILKKHLRNIVGKPFILDGFPRTLNQAKTLDKFLNDYEVIYLDLAKEKAVKRMLNRLVCECGKSYNLGDETLKPKTEGFCDNCGKKLVKRDDDNVEIFAKRYDNFLTNIEPIKNYYKAKNKLHMIDVNRNINDIFEDISEIVAND